MHLNGKGVEKDSSRTLLGVERIRWSSRNTGKGEGSLGLQIPYLQQSIAARDYELANLYSKGEGKKRTFKAMNTTTGRTVPYV